ncbi:MAG: hypothetical protein ACOZAJ_00795 [Patescibacteria group bacterium]
MLTSNNSGVVLTPGFQVVKPLLVLDEQGRQVVVKSVGQEVSIFDKNRAEILAADVIRYRSLLAEIGVVIPEMISIETVNYNNNGKWGIVEKSLFKGLDLGRLIIQSDVARCKLLVAGIIDNMVKVFRASDLSTFDARVTIDPKPSNWTFDDKGIVNYIDFIPPRFRENNGNILLEYPRFAFLSKADWDFLYSRYFDRRGLVKILFVQLCRLRPELRNLFKDMIGSFLDDINDQLVLNYFNSLPSVELQELLTKSEDNLIVKMISSLDQSSADDIRDIGLLLFTQDQQMLDQIFSLSHIDMSGRLESEKLIQLKKIILKKIRERVA